VEGHQRDDTEHFQATTGRVVKVVHVTTSDMSLRYLLLDQMRYLQSLGHAVSGVSGPGPWVDEVRAAGVRVHIVPLTRAIEPLRDLRAFIGLVVHFLRTRPDVVHTHTPKASLLGQWAAFLARVPRRVHTIHGLYFPGHMRPERRWFYVMLERLQMRPAHTILSQNREDLETCRVDRICDLARLTYLGNGIDVERFHPRNLTRRAAVRRMLGISDDALVVGMVGRVIREKGYLDYFAAAALLRRTHSNAVFLAIGPYEPWKADAILEEQIHGFGLDSSLRLLGHRDDIADLYATMDVLTLPSHREGFPRSPMEAAATGLAVVATDVRGCREAVVHGENGLLVPARDPDSLASAIARLLDDKPMRERMGRRGRELAEDRFDQRQVFARVANAYSR
jgi:glycosyltransferase involved in cell wall biosynthesis